MFAGSVQRVAADCHRAGPRTDSGLMTEFFFPMGDGEIGEHAYQELRQEIESRMGRPPTQRRIVELWSRRGNRDCVTAVGVPDPILWGHRHRDLRHGSPPAVHRLSPERNRTSSIRGAGLQRLLRGGVRAVSSLQEIVAIEAELNYYRDSVALSARTAYRRGLGTTPAAEELQRRLKCRPASPRRPRGAATSARR